MTQARLLYSSENGDCWYLVREPASELVRVRHEPNVASGGQVSEVEIAEFRLRGGRGPERTELLRLIGTLVERQVAACAHGIDQRPATCETERVAGIHDQKVWFTAP